MAACMWKRRVLFPLFLSIDPDPGGWNTLDLPRLNLYLFGEHLSLIVVMSESSGRTSDTGEQLEFSIWAHINSHFKYNQSITYSIV